jgi:hypothetical protein
MLKAGTASQSLRKIPDLKTEQEEDITTLGPLLNKTTITKQFDTKKILVQFSILGDQIESPIN